MKTYIIQVMKEKFSILCDGFETNAQGVNFFRERRIIANFRFYDYIYEEDQIEIK